MALWCWYFWALLWYHVRLLFLQNFRPKSTGLVHSSLCVCVLVDSAVFSNLRTIRLFCKYWKSGYHESNWNPENSRYIRNDGLFRESKNCENRRNIQLGLSPGAGAVNFTRRFVISLIMKLVTWGTDGHLRFIWPDNLRSASCDLAPGTLSTIPDPLRPGKDSKDSYYGNIHSLPLIVL